jgi:hypothetical protein
MPGKLAVAIVHGIGKQEPHSWEKTAKQLVARCAKVPRKTA